MSPLLTSMRVCALYFTWPFRKSETKCKAADVDKRNRVKKSKAANTKFSLLQKFSAIYAILVTFNMWINGIRLLTAFTPNDKTLPAIIMKTMIVTWNIQCAMQQAAYVLTSANAQLDRVLNDIQLNSVSSRTYFRRLTRWLTLATWLMIVINFIFFAYTTCFAGGLMDVFLVPFGTYVNVSQPAPLRVAFTILFIHQHSAWWFPVTIKFLLSCIFVHQFRSISNRFRLMLNDRENAVGTSEAEIAEIRLQHQSLCRTVKRTDRFLKFHHLAAFFCPLTELISVLYMLLLYPSQLSHNSAAVAIFSFWLLTFILELSLTVGGGIIVSKYALKIGERIHNINTSTFKSKTIGRLNMLLNRTSGDPVGFTVLGIMAIDKNAITSLLGLLITYFLLAVQMSPSGGSTSSTSGVNITGTASN